MREAGGAGTSAIDLGKAYKVHGDLCPLCSRCVDGSEQGLLCDGCNSWVHTKCMKMTDSEVEMWSKTDHPWFCRSCRGEVKQNSLGMKKMMQMMSEMMAKLNKNEDDNNDIRANNRVLGELLDSIEESITDMKGSVRDSILSEIKGEIKREISSELREELVSRSQEQEEKQKRQRNLIIYNADESETNEAEPEEGGDRMLCSNLFKGILGVNDVNIQEVIRLGKRHGGEIPQRKSRPILVKLDSPWGKYDILKNARKLKFCDDVKMRKIIIAPDLTVNERVKDRALRDELKRRREAGETDIYISKGMIKKKSL